MVLYPCLYNHASSRKKSHYHVNIHSVSYNIISNMPKVFIIGKSSTVSIHSYRVQPRLQDVEFWESLHSACWLHSTANDITLIKAFPKLFPKILFNEACVILNWNILYIHVHTSVQRCLFSANQTHR